MSLEPEQEHRRWDDKCNGIHEVGEDWRIYDWKMKSKISISDPCNEKTTANGLKQFRLNLAKTTTTTKTPQQSSMVYLNITVFTWILPGTMLSVVVKISCLALDVSGAANITFPAPVPSGLAKMNCCFGDTAESTAVTIWIFWPVCWSVTICKTLKKLVTTVDFMF